MNYFDFRLDKLIIWTTFIKVKKRLNSNIPIEKEASKNIYNYLYLNFL